MKTKLAVNSRAMAAARAAGLVPSVAAAVVVVAAKARRVAAARLGAAAAVRVVRELNGATLAQRRDSYGATGAESVFIATGAEGAAADELRAAAVVAAAAEDGATLAAAMGDGREGARAARLAREVEAAARLAAASAASASVVAAALQRNGGGGARVRAAAQGAAVGAHLVEGRAVADELRAAAARAEARQLKRAAAKVVTEVTESKGAVRAAVELVSGVVHIGRAARDGGGVGLLSGLALALAAVAARRIQAGSRRVVRGEDGAEVAGFGVVHEWAAVADEVWREGERVRFVTTGAADSSWRGGATGAGGVVVVSDTSRDDAAAAGVAGGWTYAAAVAARLEARARKRDDHDHDHDRATLAALPSGLSVYRRAAAEGAVLAVLVARLAPPAPMVEAADGLAARVAARRRKARGVARAVGRAAQAALSQLAGGMTGRKAGGAVSVVSVGCPADWGRLANDEKSLQVEAGKARERREWATGNGAGAGEVARAARLVWGRIVRAAQLAARRAAAGGAGANARAAYRARRVEWRRVVGLLRGDIGAAEWMAAAVSSSGGRRRDGARALLAAAAAAGGIGKRTFGAAAADCAADF